MENMILLILVCYCFYFLISDSNCSKKVLIDNNTNNLESKKKLLYIDNQIYKTEYIGWIENSRYNSNYNKFPPCFKLSKEAQQIYNIIENKNIIITHKVLFEVLSMILCQYNFLKSKMCVNTMIENRITDLDSLGYNRYDNRYRNKLITLLGNHYNTSSQYSIEFLLKSLTLIEDELNKIYNKINESEKNQLKSLIEKFYSDFFIYIAQDC